MSFLSPWLEVFYPTKAPKQEKEINFRQPVLSGIAPIHPDHKPGPAVPPAKQPFRFSLRHAFPPLVVLYPE